MDTPLDLSDTLPLDHWAAIRTQGPDAAAFLQGQLTSDVVSLAPGQSRLAGYCSAKGRLQATFIVWPIAADDLLLACASSLHAATLKRLSMFVLRARCKLSDAAPGLTLRGASGRAAAAAADGLAVWQSRAGPSGSMVRLPDVDGVQRCLLAVPLDAAPGPHLDAAALDAWRRREVLSGIPQVDAATVDRFVPQMLNYELIGGVDFRKGCYPGQEVVARSQYRGTLKRRMFLGECAAPLSPGDEVFDAIDPWQPAGMVVNAAPRAGVAGSVALIEAKIAAAERGALRALSADGPAVALRPLPYVVPMEAVTPE